jgi:hypothetical protein
MMTKVVIVAACAAVCGAATVGAAQNIPGNPSRPGNPVMTEQYQVNDEVKITGCVTKTAAGVFQMKNPVLETRPWFNAAGEKTVGQPQPVKSGTTFLLGTSSELPKHLNHRVEILGTLDPGSANTPPTPETIGGPGGTTGLSSGAVPRLDLPKMNIKTLKMLSTSCS